MEMWEYYSLPQKERAVVRRRLEQDYEKMPEVFKGRLYLIAECEAGFWNSTRQIIYIDNLEALEHAREIGPPKKSLGCRIPTK